MRPADPAPSSARPFGAFLEPRAAPTPLRRRLTAETCAPEPERVAACLEAVTTDPGAAAVTARLVHDLVGRLRAQGPVGGVQGLLREYSLSTAGGRGPDVPRRGAAAHSRSGDPRRPRSATRSDRGTGRPISGTAPRASSTRPPGGWCSPGASPTPRSAARPDCPAPSPGSSPGAASPWSARASTRPCGAWAASTSPARPSRRPCARPAPRRRAASPTPSTCSARRR